MKRLILLFLILVVIAGVSYGNSMEPPHIRILVSGEEEDFEIEMSDEVSRVSVNDKGFRREYLFWMLESRKSEVTFLVHNGGNTFTTNAVSGKAYDSVYTLDLEKGVLREGQSWTIRMSSAGLRLILTLIIEGFVFFLFGYRKKRSWKIFLYINLITQLMLSIFIWNIDPFQSYLVLSILIPEILILIAETTAFVVLLKEHGKVGAALYSIIANVASLILGVYMITNFPA